MTAAMFALTAQPVLSDAKKPVPVTKFDKQELEFIAEMAIKDDLMGIMKGLLDDKKLLDKLADIPKNSTESAAAFVKLGIELIIDAPVIEDAIKAKLDAVAHLSRLRDLDGFIAVHHKTRNKGTPESRAYFMDLYKQQQELQKKLKAK